MLEFMRELGRNVVRLSLATVSGLGRVGLVSSYFIRDTFRAHFNLIGQFTAPIEQELLDKEPPRPSSLNIFGQIALTIFPLTLLSWLTALTVAPLAYNSLQLFVVGFLRATNLALIDLPERQLKVPEGSMPWYRVLYGVPGFLFGALIGTASAGLIGIGRAIVNSFETALYVFASLTNLVLEQEDKIEGFNLQNDERTILKSYVLGFPGIIAGSLAGVVGAAVVSGGRIFLHSWHSAFYSFSMLTNLALARENQLSFEDHRPAGQKYGFGLPGLIVGGLLGGTLGWGVVGFGRLLSNSLQTAQSLTVSAINVVWPEDERQEGALEQDERNNFLKYGLGFPGLIFGAPIAAGALFISVLWRGSLESLKTGKEYFTRIVEQAYSAPPKEREARSFSERYLLGMPGLILGIASGTAAFGAIIAGRILAHSYLTAKSLTVSAINLVRHENEEIEAALSQDERDNFSKYVLGFPGLMLGWLPAGVGLAFATLLRSTVESWKTGGPLFVKIASYAWPNEEEDNEGELAFLFGNESQRSKLDYYGFGAPGWLLGITIGSLGFVLVFATRVLVNSIDSAVFSFISVTNLALAREDRLAQLVNDQHLARDKFGFGFPGIVLGGAVGVFSFLTVGVGRIIINSTKTTRSLTISGVNLVRHDDGQIEYGLKEDKRSPFLKYALGFPGLIIGAFGATVGVGLASVERFNKESWKTAKEIFQSFVRQALPEEREPMILMAPENIEQRSFADRYLFGALGIGLGVVSGSIAFVGVIAVRSAIHSFISAKHIFATIVNQVLEEEAQFKRQGLSRDERLAKEKYGFGFPGIIAGSLAGIVGAAVVSGGRVFLNSWRSAIYSFSTVTNLALAREDQLGYEEDHRLAHQKYGFGLPGVIVGGLLGGTLGWGVVGFGRLLSNSFQTAQSLTVAAINVVWPDEGLLEGALEQDERNNFLKYGLGFPGLILGSPIAGGAFFLSFLGRSLLESLKTGKEYFTRIVEQAYPAHPEGEEALALQPQSNTRSFSERYLLGMPGLVFGIASGSAVFGAIIAGRILAHSYRTAKSLTISAINLVRHENEQIQAALSQDERDNFSKYVLGFPGLMLGLVPAGVGFAFATLQRSTVESWKTSQEIYQAIVRQLQPAGEPAEVPAEALVVPRSFIDRYLFGAPGLVVGALSGSVVYVGLGLSRVFKESFDTGSRLFTTIANAGLNENERFEALQLEQEDQRSWQAKYLLGFPGAVAGTVFGTMTLAAIGFVKITTQSFHSWRSLSGSLLNGSLELALFGGMAADKRSNNAKYSGILGYGFAMLTTLPMGIIIFTFKKIIPVSFGLLAAVVSSPIVAGLKAINQALTGPRFVNERSPNDVIEQRFRNLYSSLTEWGQLAEGVQIPDGQNGRKGPSAFTRKAFTFNISTSTERVLDQLLTAYRNASDKEAFFEENGKFAEIIEETKAYYGEFSCLEPQAHVFARNEQIENLGAFVKEYLLGKEKAVPQHLYQDRRRNWTATFWGVEPQQSAPDVVELSDWHTQLN